MIDIIQRNQGEISINGESLFTKEGAIDNLSSSHRPILLSEFIEIMKKRYWGFPGIKVYQGGKYYTYYGPIDSMNKTVPVIPNSLPPKNKEIDILRLEEIYKDIMNREDKIFYNTSKITVDFKNSTITFDMISHSDYTNTIDLGDVNRKFDSITGKIDLSVHYVKDGKVYAKDMSFNTGSGDFTSDLGDVVVEYLGDIVRVIPKVREVDECIINNCILTYGSYN